MTRLPVVSYREVIHALQRDGWTVVRQKGSHIRLHKHEGDEVLKLTVPAHSPIKRGTLRAILAQAQLDADSLASLLR